MKKYLFSFVSFLFATSCLSSSITSDVSLSHDFSLPPFPTGTNTTATVQDCYSPNTSDVFNKISGKSSDLSWNISHMEATLDMGMAASDITKVSVLVMNANNSVELDSNPIMASQGSIVHLSSIQVNSQLLTDILNSSTMQVCVVVTGNSNTILPNPLHGTLSFHLEADFDKSL